MVMLKAKQVIVSIGEHIVYAGCSDQGQSLINGTKKVVKAVGTVAVIAIALADQLPSTNGDAHPFDD